MSTAPPSGIARRGGHSGGVRERLPGVPNVRHRSPQRVEPGARFYRLGGEVAAESASARPAGEEPEEVARLILSTPLAEGFGPAVGNADPAD